jgi:hypothetical protein
MTHRHIPVLQLPQVRFNKGEAITQHRRLALLRRYLTEEHTPARIRAIACLMLLYAQPLSRVLHLATSDITHHDGQTQICFGHPPAPVPEPFADLLHQHLSGRPAGSGTWLFPAATPASPPPTPPSSPSYATSDSRCGPPGSPPCANSSSKPPSRCSPPLFLSTWKGGRRRSA